MTNHPYSVELRNTNMQVVAVDWAEKYPFKGSWTYVLSADVITSASWGWVWMFSDERDAIVFTLKFR